MGYALSRVGCACNDTRGATRAARARYAASTTIFSAAVPSPQRGMIERDGIERAVVLAEHACLHDGVIVRGLDSFAAASRNAVRKPSSTTG
ncbi:hypothetical protein [Paraburkholderia sp. J41]|uniref:hypothetical protein n=1 Tax=Paraburkholderia sp. J41 TaxID=2805433 RepID=UPI002AC312AA|nr:hypothetical protein [Paraburkholderia sp. J41]